MTGVLVAAGAAGLALTSPASARAATASGSDWPVYHHDPAGSGVDTANTDLSPVSSAWTSPALDGQLYGEPLVEAGRVVVATENNTVYALAASSGAILWHTHVARPAASGDLLCGDIGPTVGVTSTPVIDPARSEVFVVADEEPIANNASSIAHHLLGLDLATGSVKLDAVVDPPGSTPRDQLQRAGLTLAAGRVIIGFGGNDGDCGSYHGWLVSVPEGGGPMSTFEVAPNDSEGAIWMGGAAPVLDSTGHIWVATGNGTSTSAYDYSDGVLEFNADLQPAQQPVHYFAPSSWPNDNAQDLDLGSSAPVLVPGGFVFQAGKSATAYLIPQSSPSQVLGQLASAPICGTVTDGGSAVNGSIVYSPCLNGIVRTQVTGSPAHISPGSPSSTGAGGPPIVAGGLVWTINRHTGSLYGLDPTNLDVVRQGPLSLGGPVSNHFPTPTVAEGLLLAPADHSVYAFRGPAAPPFVYRPGSAIDVGVGANGSVWVVGTNAVFGGFGIWHWTGAGWAAVPGGAVAIAVDPGGKPWVVNSFHQIFRWTGATWVQLPGSARDVGVGANGSVWVVGTNAVFGGFGIWHWTGAGWAGVRGGAVRIAVNPSGSPWVVSSIHQIFAWNGAGWQQLPGSANDVGVGANGSVWVIGTNAVFGGFGIWHWTGGGWVSVPGGAVRIAVDPSGFPWVVNSSDQIFSS